MSIEKAGCTETERIHKIFQSLGTHYPEVRTKLQYENPFQLLVAVILSAQTTDEQVNRITPQIFAQVRTPAEMARMEPSELEPLVKGCGLYHNKSRFLIEASRRIVTAFGGKVPDRFEDLITLPGVGRKTANVILNNAFHKPALAVDTHVYRVAKRLGLAKGMRAEQVENELTGLLPAHEWGAAHHRLIAHGRRYCRACRPECGNCFLRGYCPSKK